MKVVMQDGIKDCGICCLLSIIRFYGGEVSKEYLRELTNTTKEGVSLYNLIEAAKTIGFDAVGLTGKLEKIDVNNLPCIVHFIVNKSYRHFVVLYDINQKKQQVVLMDPAKGKKVISFSEFNLLTSNNYLFLKPIKKLPIIQKKHIIYQMVTQLLCINKKQWFFITLLTTSYFFINIFTSFHFKYLLELAIQYNISKNILKISYIMVTLYILKNINISLRNILLNKWTSSFDYKITTNTYKQILLLPYLYYKNRTPGEIISRFKDLNIIRIYINNLFCVVSTDFISIIVFLLLLRKYQKTLTNLIVLTSLIIGLYTFFGKKKKETNIKKVNINQDRINSYLVQGISNVDTIKGSHIEKRLIDKFSIHYKDFQEAIYQHDFFMEIYYFIKSTINDFNYTFIYGMGSYYVVKKSLSLSNLIIYQSFFSYYMNSFQHILTTIENYHSFKVALERVEEIFMISKEEFKNNYFYLPYTLEGDIKITNLNFQIGTKMILNHLDLIIKKGEKILIRGASGSGKSTLLKILLRYIEIEYGHVSINNIDINHYHLENIRSNITYVTNNEYLFPDTLKNNILLYKDSDEKNFHDVCKICLIEEIIKNNLVGYDSMVEENGFNFSNGERQRVILARSILRKSSIFIFDEALSGIDVRKEAKILTEMFKYLKDKTVIIISHRLNNQKLFDRVLKLENGKIYES